MGDEDSLEKMGQGRQLDFSLTDILKRRRMM
jgi:hypothetical protein